MPFAEELQSEVGLLGTRLGSSFTREHAHKPSGTHDAQPANSGCTTRKNLTVAPPPVSNAPRRPMLLRTAVLRGLKLPRPCRQATWVALRAFSAPVQGVAAAAEPSAHYGEQAAGITPLPHASGEPISVEAPPIVTWSPDNVNNVRLIGTVLTQPALYHTAANQTVANVVLGLRQRYGRSSISQSVALEVRSGGTGAEALPVA